MIFIISLLTFSLSIINAMQLEPKKTYQLPQPSDNADKTQEICATVLKLVKPIDITESTLNHINEFLIKKGITDYQSAVTVGGNEIFISDPKEFNKAMISYFPKLTDNKDIVPTCPKEYQVVILPLSGIDGYVRKLVDYKKLFVRNGFTAKKIFTLVTGSALHRKDLIDEDYLTELPLLFNSDLELKDNKEELRNKAKELLQKDSWTLKDGAQAAWKLVDSDVTIKDEYQKFCFFEKEKCSPKDLFESFAKETLEEPINKENPIAFIAQNFGFTNLKKTADEVFGHNNENVDFFISQDPSIEIQAKLFRQTPHQEAVIRLYQLRNMLLKMKTNN